MIVRALTVCMYAATIAGILCNYCPVSKHYDNNHHFHRYPFSIFYAEAVPQLTVAYNCNIHVMSDRSEFRHSVTLCDRNVSLCPVKEENVQSAMSVATWPQYADVFNHLGTATEINVFFLGGSMPAGGDTMCRCRCMNMEDARCPPFSLPSQQNSSYCSWPSHLSHWLTHIYSATTFHFHDYTQGGLDSRSSAHFIHKVHSSRANFSNPALFFLDFSVNDAYDNSSLALETLIHTIYNNFGRHYNTRPTVILLEQFPHAVYGSAKINDHQDYILNYRLFAKRYSLILLSMREVYWTYFGLPQDRDVKTPDLNKRLYPISPFDPNVHMLLHPPWYVHLFMADVVASCIKNMHTLFKSDRSVYHNTFLDLHNIALVPTITYEPPSPFPEPLFDRRAELQLVCDISLPFRVSATARPIELPVDQLPWHKGWIEHVSHRVPGWEINNQSDPTMRALSFPLEASTAELRSNSIMITYLQSYEGMGTAVVHVCGAPLTSAKLTDGLWDFPGSFPWTITFILRNADIARCRRLAKEKRFISIVYAPGTNRVKARAKHGHLFKIFNVQVCTPFLVPN